MLGIAAGGHDFGLEREQLKFVECFGKKGLICSTKLFLGGMVSAICPANHGGAVRFSSQPRRGGSDYSLSLMISSQLLDYQGEGLLKVRLSHVKAVRLHWVSLQLSDKTTPLS